MKKIMGIDYGDARTGVAVSDLLCSIVGSTTVINSHNVQKAIGDIVRLVQEHNVGEIVVGLPRNMDGTEGDAVILRQKTQLCIIDSVTHEIKIYRGHQISFIFL